MVPMTDELKKRKIKSSSREKKKKNYAENA